MTGAQPAIGVSALQGDFARHLRVLERLGLSPRAVRAPGDLEGLGGLILPGGESTTMLKLMDRTGLENAVRAFHANGGAVFGTCAGLILVAERVSGPRQRSLRLLDVDVERNAYGRQIHSFETDLSFNGAGPLFRGVFIRAPRITRVGNAVEILAEVGGAPVLVRGHRVLAASFHPELTDDTRIHRYFLEEMVGGEIGVPMERAGG